MQYRRERKRFNACRLRDGDTFRLLLLRRLRVRDSQDTILHGGLDVLRFRTLRDRNGTRELAAAPFPDDVPVLFLLFGEFGLARDEESAVLEVDCHVLFLQAGQLKGCGDEVVLF